MLNLLLGTDWISNKAAVLDLLAQDVQRQKQGRILIVPELISHDTERRLCAAAGDTTCRFAEVLSFTRLARRVSDSVGHAARECLDNGGRVVAMAAAVYQVQSRLKAYASVGTRPEFLTGLVDAVDEFKRCCITSYDLKEASRHTEGSLAQKLEELSLILESYDSVCQRGRRDPRDQMTWLLEELEASNYGQDHVFYIDGFPDFTRQHMEIIAYLIRVSASVTVSMNCDTINSSALAFEKAGGTAAELVEIAKRYGVEVNIQYIPARIDNLAMVRDRLFQGKPERVSQGVSLIRTETVYQECVAVAERILSLAQTGERYRDIGVVCGDMSTYQNVVNMVFERCNIPVYISGTEDILGKSVVAMVLAAIDTTLNGFDQNDVLRYLKTALSPLDIDTCDKLENYVILWGITGTKWLHEWKNHPVGLGEKWTDAAYAALAELNAARHKALEPLVQLRNGFLSAKNLAEQVRALYAFFEQMRLSQHLSQIAGELDEAGDNRNAQILNQLWEILITALEQLYDVLGKSAWDPETFTKLFKLLLSQYDVGTIPPVLDSVTAGPVSAMRCQEMRHLFVLGALEGALPGYGGSVGILSDQERNALRALGVPLTGGGMDGLQAEFAEIYGVFCGAKENITISCPSGQPSFIYQRVKEMAGNEKTVGDSVGPALVNETEAAAFLARFNDEAAVNALGLNAAYKDILRKRDHVLGNVTRENIRKLYGAKLRLSASQVDKQADCRLSYFLRYGLGAKERKPATIDPAEFGTYVHVVLEKTVADVMQRGGFGAVSVEETLQIARVHSDCYAKERFSELDTERITYLFHRNSQELTMIVRELWNELSEADFEPKYFELEFDDDAQMPAISIPGRIMDAQLRGFVDRVDTWQEGGKDYFRVVDYKTGSKDFDYCDIFNGVGLQMLLYLFALEQEGQSLIGKVPIPAGVQYFPARAPMVPANGLLDDTEAAAARNKIWKRRGLILRDEAVLHAMEPSDQPVRLSYTRKKDGSISGDLADRNDFAILKEYIFRLLGRMVDEIASGCVKPNPYTRGDSHNACRYCPYGAICHDADVEDRRDYKAMSPERFWEEIRKEMSKRG